MDLQQQKLQVLTWQLQIISLRGERDKYRRELDDLIKHPRWRWGRPKYINREDTERYLRIVEKGLEMLEENVKILKGLMAGDGNGDGENDEKEEKKVGG
ncbi:hypothetical protein P154DRAFT_577546 [Amniculicola lignicola CBS 123094]|uniref:Uncharacterized protein n=1 Tax=Amniculicola lignicola CBS 123094 TaxID=1392246 RepID=A0A6A5WFJ5_9PLEO|nr:hypothetical protein P154DRAFT_577546 [Amniculicola lignicola CBS 123094]